MKLTAAEQAMLGGEAGEAVALAMRLVVGVARASGARALLPVESVHVDGCLYHGPAGLDLAERFVQLGGNVAVRTTLNVGSLDLLHPGLVRADAALADGGRRLMDAYVRCHRARNWRLPFNTVAFLRDAVRHLELQQRLARQARGRRPAWSAASVPCDGGAACAPARVVGAGACRGKSAAV